jgi:pilus assembly protein CpaB
LKRSNRLVLLIGVFLAVIAFVGVILLNQGGGQQQPAEVTELPTVIATADIPLGTQITADQVTTVQKKLTERDTDAFGDVSQVLGKTVRQPVVTGAAITAKTLTGGTQGQILDITVPDTKRAIAVEVDQVTGVGTVIKTGDYVDMIVGFTADRFPVITTNPVDDTFTVVAGLNNTSVKMLLQGMQVLGTLLPPPPAQAEGQEQQAEPGTALNDQREIVILSVDAQQAEVIKFAQLDGSISLVLRSPNDFIDPATGKPFEAPGRLPDPTTGIILKTLVDNYGVLPPELIETVLPAQAGQ